jgi:YbbR domain-containing protein
MGWIVRNWQLKLGAVALATILYTGLVFSGSFTEARISGVPVSRINQPSGAYVMTQNLPPVEVHYRQSQDAVGTISQDSFAATVDLSKYNMDQPGTPQSLPISVNSLASGVSVLDAKPDQVTVILDVLASKEVDVRIDHGTIPDGLELGTPSLSVTRVTARGPSSRVNQVAAAEARVAVDASGIDYHNADVELRPVDASGTLVQSVELTPSVVTVDIPVDQTQTGKTLPVSVSLSGAPGAGYLIEQVAPDPLTVTLRGTPSALASVTDVVTDAISVDGLTSSRSFTTKLVLPSGLQLAEGSPESVTVRVTIAAAQASRTFLVGVTCTGLAAGTSCLPQTDQIAMTLSGPQPALTALTIAQITPVLDVGGLAPGSHDVTPTVSLPSGISLVGFSPAQVTVVIVQPTPAPTPSP